MNRRAVEALGEVLGEQLPVRFHVEHDALADAQLAEAVARVPRLPVAEGGCQGFAAFLELDEDEPSPARRRHLEQPKLFHVEVRGFHAPGRSDKSTFQVVGPGMVGTHDPPARKAALVLGAQHRAAVPAGVVKGAQPTRLIPQEHQALRPETHEPPVARRRQLLLARDGDPPRVPERLELALIVLGIAIPPPRQTRFEPGQRHALTLGLINFHDFRYSPSHATGQAFRHSPSPGAPRAGPAAAPRALTSPTHNPSSILSWLTRPRDQSMS